MIDTHAHIDFNTFDEDRSLMIQRAFSEGVEYIIVPGVEPKDFGRILGLCADYDNIFCGMGVHPHNANDANEEVYKKIIDNAGNKNVKAIGETGIDYFYDFAPKDLQQEVFRRHLLIAKQTALPAIVHNREADDDIIRIIEEEQDGNLKGVLHCFSSPLETMKKAIDLGFHISFTGNITFKKSNLSEVVAEVPFDKVMIETDSPFMAPVPLRGKRNEPSNVKYVASKIAEIKSISIDEVIKMTSRTAKKFFNLIMIIIMISGFFQSANSQSIKKDIEKDKKTEELLEEESIENPYKKFIGIGPIIASNTIIETYSIPSGTKDNSYDGLFAGGASISWGVTDYLVLELGYLYSKNTKIAEKWAFTVEPSIYQIYEITSHWIINPYSRINFFGTVGICYFDNSLDDKPNRQVGIVGGIGMYININTKYGLISLMPEWRVDRETKKKLQQFEDSHTNTPLDYYNMIATFSLPRLTVVYFPLIRF